MLRDPPLSADVVYVALAALSVPVPSVEAPSLMVTVPAGVVPEPVSVAVKVTACPTFDGFRLDATVVDVVAFTVCVRTEDVPPVYALSPPYTAVMLCGPAASVDVE